METPKNTEPVEPPATTEQIEVSNPEPDMIVRTVDDLWKMAFRHTLDPKSGSQGF